MDSRTERVEWRALRLFIGAPDSRPLIAGLRFHTPGRDPLAMVVR
jgi:hypothetical protein